jgi:hypothetical protein
MGRLAAFLPRLVALTVAWLLATAALTYAAAQRMTATVKPRRTPIVPQARKTLIVPDVRRQAYVFAKGMLGDAGFAWKVRGAVQGYAANLVASQTPQAGTRVIDTGAPTIVLTLERAGGQLGEPENAAPFAGTAVQLADVAVNTVKIPKAAIPATKKPVAKAKPVAQPKRKPVAKPKWPQSRPPAFVVAGAKKEPLNEMPLTDRAQALVRWLDANPKPTNANVSHWLYQHDWIVAGARMGWWRGADALSTLLVADKKAWDIWGIGARSAEQARQALAEVKARSS